MGRCGTTADVAGVVEFLATDVSGHVTGECIRVTGRTELVMARQLNDLHDTRRPRSSTRNMDGRARWHAPTMTAPTRRREPHA